MSIPIREKKCKAVILKMCPVGLRHNKEAGMAAAERARETFRCWSERGKGRMNQAGFCRSL